MPKIWSDFSGRLGGSSRAILALALLGGAAAVALEAWWVLVPTPALRAGPRVVEITLNQGPLEIAERLQAAGVIRSRLAFTMLATLRGTARSLKAGEYEIPRDANTVRILALLEKGKVRTRRIVFPEGGTVRDLARLLEVEGLARVEEIERLARDPALLWALRIGAPSLEGYLFPDTYYFFKGLPAENMLAQMTLRLREEVTPDLLAQAERKGLTLHELLTLASIVEREAVLSRELPVISAVFWNRIKRGMPLQADPTVQYAVNKEWGALTRADLRVDSPFNTYRYTGLPPGPIASPGKAAILAVLNPAKVKYLYFVSMDGRRHFFSRTLKEHNAAVSRYRLARAR
ncbi:MAG: endolytic transglycosylase MltG [Candidatus Methylomirabilia bacterium]